ncbi:MAG: hypothetical protein ACTSVM_00315, partial [Candidatus Ranarchaeia archaeon]
IDTGALDLDEAFNAAYFVISPLRSKCLSASESTPGPEFEGECIVQEAVPDKTKRFYQLKISPTISYIKVSAANPQDLIETTTKKIKETYDKFVQLIPEKRKHLCFMISYKRQIDLLLNDLLKRVPARPTYFRVANAREGIIRAIDGFSPEEEDVTTAFQDLTMQFQTVISIITSKQDDVTPFDDGDVKRIGLVYLKAKEHIKNYVESSLGIQGTVKL